MKHPLTLLFFLFLFTSFSQNQRKIDSLTQRLSIAEEDSFKFETIDYLFLEYLNNDIDKARECVNIELQLAQKLKFNRGMSICLTNKGVIAQMEGEYAEALHFFLESLRINEELNYNLTNSYINVALIHTELKDYVTALKYNFKALNRVRTSVDSNRIDVSRSMPGLYNNIGSDYFCLKDHKRSLEYNLAGFNTAKRLDDKISMAVAANNIGLNYFQLDQNEEALQYYNRSLDLALQSNSLLDIAEANINKGVLFNKTGKFEKALVCFEDAITYARLAKNKPLLLLTFKNMIVSFEGIKDFKKKSAYLEKYQQLNDSIYNEDNLSKISRLRTKFATEEKEKENLILAGQNQIQALQISRKNYLMIGLTLLLIITIALGWLFIRQNKAISEQKALLLEQKLLRSQMNPHFIFNSLATIESFIYENQPKEAGRYLSDFARLMRLILENSAEEFISLEKEIKTLEHYLTLQKLRLENKLDYTIEVGPDIDTEFSMIPPMITQPFIENAIEHGFRGSKQTGIITISFKKDGEQLMVEVSDNGMGIKAASLNPKPGNDHRSMAMQITKERLSMLNRTKRQKLTFTLEDISDTSRAVTGTKVIFSIPA